MLSILTEITLFFIVCRVLMIFSQLIWIILWFRWVPELSVHRNLTWDMNQACIVNQEYFVIQSFNIEKCLVVIPKVLIALINELHLP